LEGRSHARKKGGGEADGNMIPADHLHIVDLSMNGIRFQCARRVDMNGICRIKIERNSISLAMKGQVVRSTLCIEKRGDESVSYTKSL
jgi:hypothetical protein